MQARRVAGKVEWRLGERCSRLGGVFGAPRERGVFRGSSRMSQQRSRLARNTRLLHIGGGIDGRLGNVDFLFPRRLEQVPNVV